MKKMILVITVCLGISGVNGMDIMTKSSHNEWIENHSSLISKACYDADGFCELLKTISKNFASMEERKSLYESVESTWNDENVFEAVVIDAGFCFYRRDRF